MRTVDVGTVADIGVGASTVTPSSVLVTQPEGRVIEGVTGIDKGDSNSEKSATTAVPMQHLIAHEAGSPVPESNATIPKISGPGSIDAHPGALALNHSLPTTASIVTTNDARQAEQNVMSTLAPDSKMERAHDTDIDAVDLNAGAPDTRIDTLGTMIDPPSTREEDAPGTKKETGLGAGKSGKEVASHDSGEHEDMLHRVGISPVVLHRLTVFSLYGRLHRSPFLPSFSCPHTLATLGSAQISV